MTKHDTKTAAMRSSSTIKPTIIGLYGMSGCGKTTMLFRFKNNHPGGRYNYFIVSNIIAAQVHGGSDAFKNWPDGGEKIYRESSSEQIRAYVLRGSDAFRDMPDADKKMHRESAMEYIRQECASSGNIGIVISGDDWNRFDEDSHREEVMKDAEIGVYSHIIFVEMTPEAMTRKSQPKATDRAVLRYIRGQDTLRGRLRAMCAQHRIPFVSITPKGDDYDYTYSKVSNYISYFESNHEEVNLSRAFTLLAKAMDSKTETVLVMDPEKTLSAMDSSEMIWAELKRAAPLRADEFDKQPLISSKDAFSHEAFQQRVLMYEELASNAQFNRLCNKVAKEMTLYPSMKNFLRGISHHEHIKVVLVTSGPESVWKRVVKIMVRNFPCQTQISVIGNGRISGNLILTEDIKAELVRSLRKRHLKYTWVFGESSLNLPMLKQANQAIVTVTKGMDSVCTDRELLKAIDHGELRAHQILLTEDARPRLIRELLPEIYLKHGSSTPLTDYIVHSRIPLDLYHATRKPEGKLLATPLRDPEFPKEQLSQAHQRVGTYVATKCVSSELIGIAKHREPISSTDSAPKARYMLQDEAKTIVVAFGTNCLWMATGVRDMFPRAPYFQAKMADDLHAVQLDGKATVLLVTPVIETGASTIEFVKRIRYLQPTIRIVVLTGVVTDHAVNLIHHRLGRPDCTMIALRLEDDACRAEESKCERRKVRFDLDGGRSS